MQSATQLHPIWRDYPALQPELQQVMQLMTAGGLSGVIRNAPYRYADP